MKLGDIKVQSLHEKFSGFSIELENRFKPIPYIYPNQRGSINRIARMCLDLDKLS